jgi:sugar/nucleoside kinase (ribokinase family)
MTSMLKAPGANRVKLKYDELLSSLGFKIDLRRYNEEVVAAARALRARGAQRVLVTLGARGAVLVTGGAGAEPSGDVTTEMTWHAAVPVPRGKVVDATAAGDAFRAALAVVLAGGGGQGLTLVHFSAQPEPSLTQNTP